MKIVNFFLLIGCILSFNMIILGFLLGSIGISLFSLVLFGFLYYSFIMDINVKQQKVNNIHLTYFNGDKEIEVEDDLPEFDRDNFKFN